MIYAGDELYRCIREGHAAIFMEYGEIFVWNGRDDKRSRVSPGAVFDLESRGLLVRSYRNYQGLKCFWVIPRDL